MKIWIIFTLTSAFLFAIKDIIAKKSLKKDITPLRIIFGQYTLLLLIIFIIFFNKIQSSNFISLWYLYLAKAFVLTFSAIIYLKLLKKFEISIVSPMINLSPIILIFLSYFFLSEKLNAFQMFGVLLLILSTYFLETTLHNHNNKNPLKHYLKELISKKMHFFIPVFLMLLMLSFAAIFDKMILSEVNVVTNLFFTGIFIFSFNILYFAKKHNLKKTFIQIINNKTIFFYSIFSIISDIFILLAIATPGVFVSLIVPIRRTSTIISSLFGGLLFHEKHLIKKVFAVSGMITSLFIIAIL